MKKKTLFSLFLLVILWGTAFGWWKYRDETRSTNLLRLYGNIDIREVDLAVNATERITKVLFWEGDKIRRGQLMAELELERFQAEVDKIRADMAAQQALVQKLENGSRPQEIGQARNQLDEAKAQETIAWLTYKRLKRLLPRKLISKEEVDNARATVEAATARRKAAEQNLSLVTEGPRKEDIAAARARLNSLRAQLTLAEHNLQDAHLYAPADGIVRDRILEPGDIATPQRPVYTLALIDPLWARVYIPEPDLGKIRPGMVAEISTDSFPHKHYRGWVGYISPTAEFTPKTVQTEELRTHLVYQARVYVCNPEGELRLGMPVTVLIPLGSETKNESIPCHRPEDSDSRVR